MQKKINEITNLVENIDINNYINIYIYTYNICNPKKYIKNITYVNNMSILVNNENEIDSFVVDIKKIRKKFKLKIKGIKYKFIFLKGLYNFSDMKWIDVYCFYTLYNNNNNFANAILKNCENKRRLMKKIYIKQSDENITFKYIFTFINKYFDKIFKN